MKVKRDFLGMYDAAKGVLMLLVTLAHTNGFVGQMNGRTDGGGLFKIDTLLPICLFFLIAGYSFRLERDWKAYLKRQAKDLLLPYFLVPVAAALFRAALYAAAGQPVSGVSGILLGFLWGACQPMELFGCTLDTVGALWFLPALFFGGLLHQALLRLPSVKIRRALLWGVVLAAACIPSETAVRLPWFLAQSCTCLGYLELGRLLKKTKAFYRPLPVAVQVAMGVLAACLLAVFHRYSGASLWANVWTFGALDYFGSALAAAVLLRFYLQSGLAAARLTQPLATVGRYSLYFLAWHGFELVALPWGGAAAALFASSGLPDWGILLLLWAARSAAAMAGCAATARAAAWMAARRARK